MVQFMPKRVIVARRLTGRVCIKPRVSWFLRRLTYALQVEVEDEIDVVCGLTVERREKVRHWRDFVVDDLNGNTLRLDIAAEPLARVRLDLAPETPAPQTRGGGRSTRPLRPCGECGEAFAPAQPGQLFCRREHKRAFNNRWLKRGAVVAPLYAAARETRGGTRGDRATGARARRDAEQLAQRWKEEDAAAGRLSATAYIAARYRSGRVELP